MNDHNQPAQWRNRIVGNGEESPEQLLANPKNWRIHPKAQQDGLAAILDRVGWVQNVIVNQRTGHLVDGHLRVTLAMRRNEPTLPVLYVDLSPEEENLILTTLDPLAGFAVTDADALRAILSDTRETNDDLGVLGLLASIESEEGLLGILGGTPTSSEGSEDGEPGSGGSGGDDGDEPSIPSDGSLLALTKITVADPDHKVERGDVWKVGRHFLICAEVLLGWSSWVEYLKDDAVFAPFPGPFVPLTMTGDDKTLVMVQPNPYVAGHILDQFVAVRGKGSVAKIEAKK